MSSSLHNKSQEELDKKQEEIDESKQDDARGTRRDARRAVIFDEDNLRQNKEWHDANPVTKHIDEPKTGYARDEGEFDEEDKEQLAEMAKEDQHIEARTKENTEKNKTVGKLSGGNNTTNEDETDWADAAYNKVGSEALRNNPIAFTSVAPATSSSSTGGAKTNEDAAVGERRERSNDDDDNNNNNTGKSKRPVGLKLNSFSEEQQEEAEKARHEAEFKTMRKAVYRDEGLKFREMMKAAQKANEDDEDETVDED